MDEQLWNINPIDTCSTQSVQNNIKQHKKKKVEKRKHKKTNDKKK